MRFRSVVLVLLISVGVGYAAHRLVFTDEVEDYTPGSDQRFEYGSIGSEPGGSLLSPEGGLLPPYKVFRVLPVICPDLLPGRDPSAGYSSFGLIYERGKNGGPRDLPIGVSRRRRFGIQMLGVNCALCHLGTVRDRPGAPPTIYPGMPPQQPDVQRLFRFTFDCIQDPRFTADRVIEEIKGQKDGDLTMGFIERLAYRMFVIPKLKDKIRSVARELGVLVGTAVPASGPGRLDTVNPGKVLEVKEQLAGLPIAELKGSADFPHIWELSGRNGRLHWDGNLGSVDETILSAALAVGAKPNTLDLDRFKDIENYVKMKLKKPRYPYERDPGLAARVGQPIFERLCAKCHRDEVGQVTPLETVGTDPSRFQSFTVDFAEKLPRALNRHYAGSMFQFRTFRKTDGYVNVPLDGLWARAPYLHNGSVPTLRDLLAREECRPRQFYRGSDVYDRENVGFMSWAEPAVTEGCSGQAAVHREPSQSLRSGPDGILTDQDGNRLFPFETRAGGNRNTGHSGLIFGTELSKPEKDALIEYLKSL